MSGIVGYIGNSSAQPILLDCLTHLDYRGYDSAGVAISNLEKIELRKETGRIEDLDASLQIDPILEGHLGIGHTRWASHGAPTILNAHPITDEKERFIVVHNGIIENYLKLKSHLISQGYLFVTDTDTEVIPHLLVEYDTGDVEETVRKVLPMLKGSFALAIMSRNQPDTIIGISQENPLIVGFGNNEAFLSSDIAALLSYTKEIHPIKNGEIAVLRPGEVKIKTIAGDTIHPKKRIIEWHEDDFSLQDYDHYMLKEIMEQPAALKNTLKGRLTETGVQLPELDSFFEEHDVSQFRRIIIVANGTSYHSGLIGKKVMETMLDIPIETAVSSEFCCEHGPLNEKALILIISQSGETADTLSAWSEAKRYGCPTIAITNKRRGNLARKADYTICTNAGPELAVPATKAYTTQITVLLLLSILFTEKTQGPGLNRVPDMIKELHQLPEEVDKTLIMTQDAIDQFAQVTEDQQSLFLIGRGLDYVLALEGALKLQEVAYLHADAYAAGEMKHGTMALITPGVPVIALSTQKHLREKTINNIKELKARDAFVVGVTTIGDDEVSEIVDEVMYIPEAHPYLMPIIAAIPLQLLAYYAGTVRGYNVDRPRNLAKSLTVE
ncbi:glutamine--fructose-6-phosphate transaminase (isomerizing) [Heyndrickxia acidicola]|uniref:Glutamine--fructose-6-phosphate aminotransferase [isomerizing] n=1 Tax=Heyndrickxia acidicola TaxID=209389 RepID=A0ABU6MGR8_9BACI|nr:glutamine--fructose-6-phosphate transaminase (isomerizing) [Heyndrickxia acidicola]MED1203690.1 glutamine--fructose-6-phosphate transaminase (isomerizing) [Heyndrickxia acidicola]